MPVTRRVAHLKQGAAATSSCPLSHDPGMRPRTFISPFRSRFESRLGVLPSLLAHLVWAIWTPLGSVFKASLRVQRTSPPVCVPHSSACASPVPQPFQSNHSSEHCTPGLGFGGGGGRQRSRAAQTLPGLQGGPEAAGPVPSGPPPSCAAPSASPLSSRICVAGWGSGQRAQGSPAGLTGPRGFWKRARLLKARGAEAAASCTVRSLSSPG